MAVTIDTDLTVVDYLRRNAREHGDDVALVEINPQRPENRHITWRDYDLVETTEDEPFRREITWSVFDEKANRFANLLLSRGVRRGDKVAILLYNCIEWLPIYFGVLKTGAIAVPLNFRYAADEISYCIDKADVNVLVFGPEFIGRLESVVGKVQPGRLLLYVGDDCPTWAEPYQELASLCSSVDPDVPISNEDDAAIYYSSGTTGFPKAILHQHQSLTQAAQMEQVHHGQTRGSCCAASRRNSYSTPSARSAAPSSGCSCLGSRTFSRPSSAESCGWKTITSTSGG